MWHLHVAMVRKNILDADEIFAQSAAERASQFDVGPKHASRFDDGRDRHIELTSAQIRIDDRLDDGSCVRVRAVQAELLTVLCKRAAGVERAAANQQTAVEAANPLDAAMVRLLWSSDAAIRVPRERVAAIVGVGNIQAAIDHHLITQAAAGVDPRNANATPRAIVEHRRFNAAQLVRIDHWHIREWMIIFSY